MRRKKKRITGTIGTPTKYYSYYTLPLGYSVDHALPIYIGTFKGV